MNRRDFITQSILVPVGAGALPFFQHKWSARSTMASIHSFSGTFQGAEIKVHALPTGKVKVKKSHRGSSLGLAQILLDFRWTEWLPVYCWLIEHPEGNILIDTGENAQVGESEYFDCDSTTGWVNKRILQFDISREQEIDKQLMAVGISSEAIRWLVLTHLHLDHVDGLGYFPQSEILVSQTEFQHPYGAVPCLWPSWFNPRTLTYSDSDPYFSGRYSLTQDGCIQLVPTPGLESSFQ